MEIKAEEITRIIEQQIKDFSGGVDIKETGTVISVGDGIARVYGLENAMYNELLIFENNVYGLALNLEEDLVGAMLLGETKLVKEGDIVRRSKRILEVPA
ncbi:MAG: F0F1 ATP synthase subunit alpha, partial [Candidatus Saccharicenans sp.]|nr:F0F1 ATP synthase subunit alpha [Candidatus Saccharicenans sp.]